MYLCGGGRGFKCVCVCVCLCVRERGGGGRGGWEDGAISPKEGIFFENNL